MKIIERYTIEDSFYYPHELVLSDDNKIYVYHDKDGEINYEEILNIDNILDYLEEQTSCEFDKHTKKLVNKAINNCNDKDSKICGYLFMLDLECNVKEEN